jgi:hypothetical protein
MISNKMSGYSKYTTLGGLNPYYVNNQCEETDRNSNLSYIYDATRAHQLATYESRLEFLQLHSGSTDEYEMAKAVLGIQEHK